MKDCSMTNIIVVVVVYSSLPYVGQLLVDALDLGLLAFAVPEKDGNL